MADESDEYDDITEELDEDIAALEDNPAEEEEETPVIAESGENIQSLAADTPIYRLKLPYANATFLAIYLGGLLHCGRKVLVPTKYGKDLAQVIGPVQRKGAQVFSEIVRIERPASKEDLEKADYNRHQEETAFVICKEKIDYFKLDMKLVSAHYLLEEPKILFFFTAEKRVDFRELVKDLVSIFKMRIELRQIGVRDEARVVGGLGVCGRAYCCHSVSDTLKPVSIKMAKEQNLSLNSMKISGACGRLLCCLSYEHTFYSEQRKFIPQEGNKVTHEDVLWKVIEVNLVSGKVVISNEDGRQLHLPATQFEKVDGRWRVKAGQGAV